MIRYQVHPSLISLKIDFIPKVFEYYGNFTPDSQKSVEKHFKVNVDMRMTLVLVKSQMKHLNYSELLSAKCNFNDAPSLHKIFSCLMFATSGHQDIKHQIQIFAGVKISLSEIYSIKVIINKINEINNKY